MTSAEQQSDTVAPAVPTRDFIRRAIEQSNLNALRLALLQATADPVFAAISVEQAELNGGSSTATVVARDDRERLIEAALDYLGNPIPPRAVPDAAETRRMIELFAGRTVTDHEFQLSDEQLAFRDPIAAFGEMRAEVAAALPPDFHVLVIGAGFGGIAAGVYFSQLGITFTIVDRQDGLGGTWRANRYPAVRVDVPTRYYQFTFEQDYPWKHKFAPGGEVADYIDHVAVKRGVAAHVRHGVSVTGARWDDAAKRWDVACEADGAAKTLHAQVIISAAGLFNQPHLPAIPGLADFAGPAFHTTAWPQDLDLAGKRIAVIGTGSTGSQLVPRIAESAAHVTVFQRSPNWVSPVEGYHETVPEETNWLLGALPYYSNWLSFGYHWQSTQDLPGLQVHDAAWQAGGGLISPRSDRLRAHLIGYIREKLRGDETLIAKCIPDYAPWTRRMVRDNGWYDALLRDNVDLVSAGIDRIEPDAVVAGDGSRHPADIIVLSTGFAAEQYLWPVDYVGRDGLTLSQAWSRDGARSHLGLAMPGFPNLFMLYGPNSQPRSGAITKWLEIWARYAAQAVATLVRQGHRSVEATPEAFAEFNASIDSAAGTLIWESAGKSSYYVNQHGRSGVNMPWPAEQYYDRTKAFDPADYRFD